MKKLKIFSFFSGSGFLDLGFEMNGFDVEFVNEYHPAFMKAYKYSREKMGLRKPQYGYFNGDINDFLGERSEELNMWVSEARSDGSLVGFIGGPPCPDFSVAGKQKGRDGENGKLSLSYVNLIIAAQPDFFLFENVKGLWKTKRHREFFDELKAKLNAAGYSTTERLTNALEYGAPQDRDRILMFGLKKALFETIYQDRSIEDFPWSKYQTHNLVDIKNLNWPKTEPYQENSVSECPAGIPMEMTVEYWFRKNDVEKHPNSNDHFTPKAGKAKMEFIDEGDDGKKSC